MLNYEDYIEQFEEDTIKLKEFFFKVKLYKNNINSLKKYTRNNKNKNIIENRLKMAQKELFLTKRYLLRIIARTLGRYELNEHNLSKRMKVLVSEPSSLF